MPTQLTTTTGAAGLGYATQNKMSVLWDGSLIWLDYDGTNGHLYQITSPGGTPSNTSVQTFAITSATQINGDIFTVDNGNSTNDVWVATASNSGTNAVQLQHATYNASGVWAWDTLTTVPGVGATAGDIVSVVWTGTYLIVGWRDGGSNVWSFKINYTTTKNGTAGWQASSIQLSSTQTAGTSGEPTHYEGMLHYDSTLGITIAPYALGTTGTNLDQLVCRALANGSIPALANWTAETTLVTGLNIGGANIASAFDHTSGYLHIAWCDSATGTTKSPGYLPVTFSGAGNTTITAGTALAIGTSTAATQPDLCVDGGGHVYVFWGTAAVNATGNIDYVSIASPYGASNVSTTTTLTSSGANYYPHVPNRQRVANGYVPLIYQTGTASPYGIQYDNSIAASTGGTTLSRTAPTSAQFLFTGSRNAPCSAAFSTTAFSRNAPCTAQFQATLSRTAPCSAAFQSSTVGAPPLTMVADTTKTTSWTAPSAGSDTETQYNAQNSAGDGVRFGSNPSYGGMPFSAWYEMVAGSVVNTAMNGVNAGSQTSMATSVPDGHLHFLSNTTATTNGSFVGTEDVTGFTLTEQAPTQTAFRRYVKTSSGTLNGLTYTVWACVYPGDPCLIAWRVDVTAGGSVAMNSAGSTDNIELCTPAGLLSNSGTSPNQGVWVADSTHSYYGTVGGTTTGGIPDGTTSNTAGEPDFLAFLPKQAVGSLTNQRLGVMTTKFTKWADVGLTASGFASLSNTSRVKSKWGGNAGATLASGTYTFYLLEALKSNLTTTQMAAIAADYLNPGSPTVSVGTLTTFTYPNHTGYKFNLDEACYVVATSSNAATITLDLTPANVTVRYCPRFKFTGYTAAGNPTVTWGGSALTSGTDYTVTVDATNHICYLQLQRDVVASGATGTQLNTAALAITSPTTTNSRTAPTSAQFKATLSRSAPCSASFQSSIVSVLYSQIVPSPVWATDPDRVEMAWERPDGIIRIYVYTVDPQVTRVGVGQYQASLPISLPGTYTAWWSGDGVTAGGTSYTF